MSNFLKLAALLIFALPVQAFDMNNMTEEERMLFRQEIRSYLLENPSVLIEAMDNHQAAQQALETKADVDLVNANLDSLVDDGMSFIGGNPEGDVTIVEFLDYRCGYCRKAHSELAELLTSDGNIRWIVKEYPILGEESLKSSQLAISILQAKGPEAYHSVHNQLMEYSGNLTEEAIGHFAGEYEIDGEELLAAMESDAVQSHIQQTRELGQKMQVSGTPTFVVGDQMIRGYLPANQMQDIVKSVRNQLN